jgi:hypothetical protein
MTRRRPCDELPAVPATLSIAQDLELRRLTHRADRMQAVVEELQRRARFHAARHGAVPAPLRQAIDDFRVELRRLRRRIAATGAD